MHACLLDSLSIATIFGEIATALTFSIFYATFLFKNNQVNVTLILFSLSSPSDENIFKEARWL